MKLLQPPIIIIIIHKTLSLFILLEKKKYIYYILLFYRSSSASSAYHHHVSVSDVVRNFTLFFPFQAPPSNHHDGPYTTFHAVRIFQLRFNNNESVHISSRTHFLFHYTPSCLIVQHIFNFFRHLSPYSSVLFWRARGRFLQQMS